MRIVTAYVPSLVLLLLVFFECCESRAVTSSTLDSSLTTWESITLHVGESIVFAHRRPQSLYLFHNRRAFQRCMFDQATVVHQGTSILFKWQLSSPGYYYFSSRAEGSRAGCEVNSMNVQVRVITPDPSPDYPSLPTPAPTSGSDSSSTPSSAWMLRSPSASPGAPAPDEDFGPLEPRESRQAPATAPTSEEESDGTVPFISSNPAVPIPMGETDTATFHPLLAPGSEKQVTGQGSCCPVQTLLVVLLAMASLYALMVDERRCFPS